MGFGTAIKSVFSQYGTFSGRARRSEFWWWYLFESLAMMAAGVVLSSFMPLAFANATSYTDAAGMTRTEGVNGIFVAIGVGLFVVVWLGLVIPTFAVMARRLHDMGQTAAWLLLYLVGLGIVPVIMVFFDSQPGSNRFGDNPKGVMAPLAPGHYGAYPQ